jgi:GGDEF domain-containing protein
MHWERDEPEQTERSYRNLLDGETGLPGEVLLRDRLGVSLARARRCNRSVLVVWFELRPPAEVERVLVARRVASALLDAVRPDDAVARVGQWEFVVLCNDLAHEDAVERIVRRLHAAIRRGVPDTFAGEPVTGIGTALGPASQHPRLLLARARSALRPVKVAATAI